MLGDRDNNRYGSFTFLVGQDSCVHGIAGYFDAVLYGSATISELASCNGLSVCASV